MRDSCCQFYVRWLCWLLHRFLCCWNRCCFGSWSWCCGRFRCRCRCGIRWLSYRCELYSRLCRWWRCWGSIYWTRWWSWCWLRSSTTLLDILCPNICVTPPYSSQDDDEKEYEDHREDNADDYATQFSLREFSWR